MAAVKDILGETVINSEGEEVIVEQICKDKIAIGIYFSAQWCSPCRSFTPILKRFFEENAKDFAVVFVSSDIDQSAFDEYFSTMPWYAVQYTDTELKEQLTAKYKIRGTPSIVVLRPGGEVIEENGRSTIQTASRNSYMFPDKWKIH
ncbi:uncharacterized protein LOC132746575 [Ruditapes philippinarum]|uniref:uncharacterized protein LOC132746575 n=1 Tax=Ruditapes philippinarum TaxID=129788 RepID=UPI00295C2EA6|nr:uncharacterized protein LOC132746575 [Ruditapes philippinarum]